MTYFLKWSSLKFEIYNTVGKVNIKELDDASRPNDVLYMLYDYGGAFIAKYTAFGLVIRAKRILTE